ncbi:DUF6894 family protein [Microvirga zambiensis]
MHFFFHLRGGSNSFSLDDLGLELPDTEAAYLEAVPGRQGHVAGMAP